MKLRLGFVSNSSTSSFILRNITNTITVDLAIEILNERFRIMGDKENYQELINRLLINKEKLKYSIIEINEEDIIIPYDKYVLVQCNNCYSFYNRKKFDVVSFSDLTKEESRYCKSEEDLIYKVKENSPLRYFLEYDEIGTKRIEIIGKHKCENGHIGGLILTPDGRILCTYCIDCNRKINKEKRRNSLSNKLVN